MAPFQPALQPAQAHNNQQLFSDYYLNMILPARPEWRRQAHDARPVLEQVTTIVNRYTPSENEAQTERDLVRPILEALGHSFEVQAALKTPDGMKKPDYIFYRDQTAQNANKGKVLDDALLAPGGIAVGDAKYWDRPLDITLKSGGDPFNNKNPGYQIAFYIQHSGLAWGILTNGRLWRLYHKDTAHKLDRFYEVDLKELVEAGDAEGFLYFYGFFHRSAFEPHPLGLTALLRASVEYARGVGDTLKAQVYEALRHLAQGFLDYSANGLAAEPETLKAIYDNALIALYRMLFILYAEARELLPVRESPDYRDSYSLESIKQFVAGNLKLGRSLLPGSAMVWPRLKQLFQIIDAGSPPIKVATFNGGLFDPRRQPFLERYTVGDAHLQQAIDKLARVGGEFVDYRDLAERHLGTIYEGLLEYHLEAIPPEGTWTVALLNDKGERKASGSYYTPDYIVKYIVDQTVGPALRDAVAGLDDDRAKVKAVLGVNVLDPAMGSGHFLVEATEYIARFLVDLAVTPDADAHGEAELQYWKRRVAQSCIYGVDLNPLAVDLAKLSLWLSTVAKDRPLSFLDHHLRTGNALIGARIADLHVGAGGAGGKKKSKKTAQANGQLSLLDDDAFRQSMSTAVDSMWLIEGSAGETVEEVKQQERIYADLRESLTRKYGRLADLVTGTYFGVKIDPTFWQPLADYATGRTVAALPRFTEWLDTAEVIAGERRFFHWELEFPEVFFDKHGQPLGEGAGFDAVVGNPPYIRAETADKEQRQYIMESKNFQTVWGRFDVYLIFIEQGIRLLKEDGFFGNIVPSAVLTINYAERLREWVLKDKTVRSILDARGEDIFPGIGVSPCVLIIQDRQPEQNHTIKTVSLPQFRKGVFERDSEQALFLQLSGFAIQLDLQTEDRQVKPVVDLISVPLSKFCYFTTGLVGHNPLTGESVDRLIHKTPINSSCKPYIEAKEWSGRYSWITPSRYIEYRSQEMHRSKFPELFESSKILVQRITSGTHIPATLDTTKVYVNHVINCCVKAEDVLHLGSNRLNYDVTLFDLPNQYRLAFFLAIVASRLVGYYHNKFLSPGLDIFPETLRQLPIRRINFTTPPEERDRLRDKGQKLYEQFCAKDDYACVLGFVEHQLPKLEDGGADTANEKSDVVHDLLAHLAEQMIDLNKRRQAAVEDFVLDLEGVLALKDLRRIERLWTPPAKQNGDGDGDSKKLATYEKTMAEARAQLGDLAERRIELRGDIGKLGEEQWKWLLKRRLQKIESLADLVKTYRKHQPAIGALGRRIAATDRLIDQVVYRLYGLTEDEIAIVEGRVR
jgi:hypothetical protein